MREPKTRAARRDEEGGGERGVKHTTNVLMSTIKLRAAAVAGRGGGGGGGGGGPLVQGAGAHSKAKRAAVVLA